MSENLHEILDDINDIADTEVDMNEASGGGDYTPPAAGLARLRFVTYIELGKQDGTFNGKPKISDKVVLGFELFGPKWPADENGKQPYVEFEINKSLTEKAGFFKIFKAMNWEGKAKIMAQLLGKDFLGRVIHREYTRRDGKKGIAVEFYDKPNQAYTITMPFQEDVDTGESKRITVPPATREIRYFIWSKPNKKQWDGIFIDGEWEERKDEKTGEVTAPAKSKNKFQLKIKGAKNFNGSPIASLLEGVDDELLNEEARKTPEEAIAEKKAKAAEKPAKESKPKADKPAKQADQKPSKPAASEPAGDDEDGDSDEALNSLPL